MPPATSRPGDACKHEANPAAGKSSSKPSKCRTIEGRLTPIQEIVMETIRTAPNTAQTRRDVFRFPADGRRRLLETTESLQETLANGDTSAIHNTWAPDLNGRLRLTSRQIEQTRSAAPDVRQTDTTLLVPYLNETLRETERTEYTERRINPGRSGTTARTWFATSTGDGNQSKHDAAKFGRSELRSAYGGRDDSTSGHEREAGGR